MDQRHGQSVDLKVFDKDQGSANDDSLGRSVWLSLWLSVRLSVWLSV